MFCYVGFISRVQDGECYHLFTRYHSERLDDYLLPEILRTRLEELCLKIKLLKLGMILPFVQKAMQPPSLEALGRSVEMLRDLVSFLNSNSALNFGLGFHLLMRVFFLNHVFGSRQISPLLSYLVKM